jgi:hypothetical protein
VSDRCERRFSNGIYLLTCELNKGHGFHHMDGEESWEADEGFDYIYEGGLVMGTTLPRCEERLDINTQCCEKAEPGKTRCRYHGPQVETLEESAKRAPKFYKDVVKLTADKDGFIDTSSMPKNKTIAERLAEREALNASLTKKP